MGQRAMSGMVGGVSVVDALLGMLLGVSVVGDAAIPSNCFSTVIKKRVNPRIPRRPRHVNIYARARFRG